MVKKRKSLFISKEVDRIKFRKSFVINDFKVLYVITNRTQELTKE